MTVIVNDTRTLIAAADSTTGYSGSAALTLFTSDPTPVEQSGCIGMAVSSSTDYVYYTMTAVNMSASTLVYVWILANGTMDTQTNGGITLVLGDGTNRIGFHLAGSDAAGFRHSSGPVGWQCLLLDTASLPAVVTEYEGTLASLNLAAITDVGAGFKTLSKALGGASNCFIDIMRYGNDGLIVTGGTSGTPGIWEEIVTEDKSDTDLKAYGIVRELGSGVYGLQGSITFGDSVGTDVTWFESTSSTIVFEDRGLTVGSYYYDVTGNATGDTTFIQTGTAISGAHLPSITMSNANIDTLEIDASSFAGTGLITFGASSATRHVLTSSFSGCLQVDPSTIQFENNTLLNYTGIEGGALLWPTSGNVINCNFINNDYAIEITQIVNQTFNGLTFDDVLGKYDVGLSGGTSIEVAKTGGSNPNSYFDHTVSGDTVTFTASFDHTLTGMVENTEVTYVRQSDGVVVFHVEDVTVTGTTTYTHSGGELVDIMVFHVDKLPEISNVYDLTLPNGDATIQIAQFNDDNYLNP